MEIYPLFPNYKSPYFALTLSTETVTPGYDPHHGHFLYNHQNNHRHALTVFLEGNASFFVEGNVYDLSPGDIVFVNSIEYHNLIHHKKSRYTRIALDIDMDFYDLPNCRKYEFIFTSRIKGYGNHILYDSELGKKLEICLRKMIEYISENERREDLIHNTFLEFMEILNTKRALSPKKMSYVNIRNILKYIDEHFTEPITLNSVAKHFFMSKSYLCRIFKPQVGYTVNQYITKKRIDRAIQLRQQGISLKQSASAAGFKNYVDFYRAYHNTTGSKPSNVTPY